MHLLTTVLKNTHEQVVLVNIITDATMSNAENVTQLTDFSLGNML